MSVITRRESAPVAEWGKQAKRVHCERGLSLKVVCRVGAHKGTLMLAGRRYARG